MMMMMNIKLLANNLLQ